MLEHRRFRFFPCRCDKHGKQSSARSPSSKYLRSYGKHNKLFLVLFRIFLTAFPFDKDGCQHSSRERGRRRQGVCRESRPYLSFEFRSRVFVLFPFQFEIKQSAILLPWKLVLSNESRSFCTRLFLFRFINRNRNTAQKEYALNCAQRCLNIYFFIIVLCYPESYTYPRSKPVVDDCYF